MEGVPVWVAKQTRRRRKCPIRWKIIQITD
jgi:hypothetical protein